MPPSGPIVDTHIHFYRVTRPGGVPWPPQNADKRINRDVLPAEYKRLARRHGIVAAGIVEASPLPLDNRWVLDLVRGDDFFPFFVASLDVGASDFAARLDDLAKDSRVVGVRAFLSGPEITLDARQIQRLGTLAARGMTLDLISRGTKNPKDKVAALARAVPELRIIINHLAGAKGRKVDPSWSRDLRTLAERGNVFMKWSSFFDMYGDGEEKAWRAPTELVAYKDHFDVLFDAFGADRLVWGSNWPVSDMGGDFGLQIAIAEQYLAAHGARVRNKVMADNARSFYRRRPATVTPARRP